MQVHIFGVWLLCVYCVVKSKSESKKENKKWKWRKERKNFRVDMKNITCWETADDVLSIGILAVRGTTNYN